VDLIPSKVILTLRFLDHIDIEDYKTESQMVDAALENEWFQGIVNSYLLSSDESVIVFK
jgi:hypothetical protein